MIERLDWDSSFFKKNIGKYTVSDKLDKGSFYEIARNFDLVYLFSSTPININAKLMDIKLTFSKEVKYYKNSLVKCKDFDIKKHDYIQLLELVYLSGHKSRFFRDIFFSTQQYKLLYKTWIDKNIEKDKVLVHCHKNKIVGFVSFNKSELMSTIELIAVHKDYQGLGIGHLLVQSVEYYLKEKTVLKVATQKLNKGAIKFYKSYGFNLLQEKFIYHYEPNAF